MSIALPPGGALPQNSQAIGWHDDTRVAYLQAAEEQVVLWNTVTGAVEELPLPNTANATQVVPIGDGAHFMVASGSRIDLITGGTAPNITPLAVDCLAEQISITGLVS